MAENKFPINNNTGDPRRRSEDSPLPHQHRNASNIPHQYRNFPFPLAPTPPGHRTEGLRAAHPFRRRNNLQSDSSTWGSRPSKSSSAATDAFFSLFSTSGGKTPVIATPRNEIAQVITSQPTKSNLPDPDPSEVITIDAENEACGVAVRPPNTKRNLSTPPEDKTSIAPTPKNEDLNTILSDTETNPATLSYADVTRRGKDPTLLQETDDALTANNSMEEPQSATEEAQAHDNLGEAPAATSEADAGHSLVAKPTPPQISYYQENVGQPFRPHRDYRQRTSGNRSPPQSAFQQIFPSRSSYSSQQTSFQNPGPAAFQNPAPASFTLQTVPVTQVVQYHQVNSYQYAAPITYHYQCVPLGAGPSNSYQIVSSTENPPPQTTLLNLQGNRQRGSGQETYRYVQNQHIYHHYPTDNQMATPPFTYFQESPMLTVITIEMENQRIILNITPETTTMALIP